MKHLTHLLLLGCMILSSWVGMAQPDKVYYTDSDIEKHYASFGIHFDPLYTHRRLFALNNADANSNYDKDNFPASGGFGYNWGGYVNFNINSSLRLGVGAGQTTINYTLEKYKYYYNGDTSSVNLKVNGVYNTFPLRIGFSTPMNDVYSLEIWIPIAYNKLVTYQENTSISGENLNEDLTEQANSDMWSVAIQVGGAFHLTDHWSVIASAQFRYFTTPMIEKANRPTETPYGAGLTLGLRYRM
ncbi:MAG: hypothetical protein EP346_09750 [Bacteroidetes bacterium]|nr:MAG: hypothetical protein EP346_09750 [Bacteroidota bacterium]